MQTSIKNTADLLKILRKRRRFFLLLILVCLAAYFNILDNAFVSDDTSAIVRSSQLGDFLSNLKSLNFCKIFRSLIFISFGKSSVAFHAVNLVLHTLASVLIFFFVLIVTSDEKVSRFSAIIFALHPIHTEAVAWVSGGNYIFFSVLFLISFVLYHLYLESDRKPLLVLSLVLYVASMTSSFWSVPLILIFPLYELYLRKRKVNWLLYGILLSLGALFILFSRGRIVSRIFMVSSNTKTIFRNPAVSIPHSLTQYLLLLFFPLKLSFYHEGEVLTVGYLWVARLISIFFLFILPLIFRKKQLFIFFFLFFLLGISPSLSPIQLGWYVAERYLYLPSVSFCVFLAYLLIRLGKGLEVRGLAAALLVPISAFYFIRTVIRNDDWQSRASLWFATAVVSPRSPRVHNNLGDIYGGWGDWENAIREFELARQLQPGYADATHNLGNVYLQLGDLENAEKYFSEAIEYNPKLYQSYLSLGAISRHRGDLEKAKAYFEKALTINPNYEDARRALEALENKN